MYGESKRYVLFPPQSTPLKTLRRNSAVESCCLQEAAFGANVSGTSAGLASVMCWAICKSVGTVSAVSVGDQPSTTGNLSFPGQSQSVYKSFRFLACLSNLRKKYSKYDLFATGLSGLPQTASMKAHSPADVPSLASVTFIVGLSKLICWMCRARAFDIDVTSKVWALPE